jgi:hypothetical protein
MIMDVSLKPAPAARRFVATLFAYRETQRSDTVIAFHFTDIRRLTVC